MLLLSACGNVSENAMTHDAITRVPEMSEAAAEATRTAGTPGAGGGGGASVPAGEVAQEVTITLHDIFFDPKEITIPANTNVKVILPNEGAAVHNFSIPDQDISVDVAPGETKDVVINLPAGEYAFDCNVPGHKEAGMVGTLKVEEGAGGAAPAAGGTPAAGAEGTPVAAGDGTPAAAGAAAPAVEEATPAEAAAPAAAAEPVTIVSHDIFFDPKEVTIPANTDVTITLPNEGVTMHNFSIEELGISVDIQPGETKDVVVNAPAGTYEIICNVPGHKEAGMVGTLTVTEEAAAPAADTAPAADAAPAAATAEQAASPAPAAETAAPAAAAEPVTIVSHDIFFDPKEVSIPANTDVTFTLPNEGVTLHNFSIPDLGISVDIQPGETKEVVVNAPAGTYAFDCNVPGHKEAGMVGTLTVTEGAAAGAAADTAAAASAEQAAATPAPAATPAAETAAPTAAAEPVTIVSHDIFFDPKEVSIPANTDVTFTLPNEGVTMHNFSIEKLGVNVDIQPGETKEIVVNAPAGTYEIICNVPGHKEAGMVGTLTVTESAGAAAPAATAPAAATAEQAAATPPAEEAAAPASAAPVTVTSHDIFFDPKEITIPANTDVTISLPNEGVTTHDFSIDALGISVSIDPGATENVVVNAPAGTYEYYCNIPGHKAAGMVGTLIVK